MKTISKLTLVLLAVFISASISFGQKGVEDGSKYGHGEDSIRCLTNLSLYSEFYKQNNYEDAAKPWTIVYNECPKASKNIYLHGEKMITDAIENTDNEEKREVLIDSLMRLYDKRIKYFAQKGFVLGKKGLDWIKYSEKNINTFKKGYEILNESIDLRGKKSSIGVLVSFIQATGTLYDNNELSGQKVVANYDKALKILDARLDKNANDSYAQRGKEVIDKIFKGTDAATCDNVIQLFKPRFEQNTEDIELLKKITSLLDELNCTHSKLYADASEQLNKLEPSAESAHHLAKLFYSKNNYDKTVSYYKEAIKRQEDKEKKAKYYLELGEITFTKLNDKPQARSYARKAIELDPDNGKPFILIGRLYAKSQDECGSDEFEKKTVLWAAVDKFIKAKNVDPDIKEEANGYINSYKPRFPDKRSIFFHNLELGGTYTIGCWINETTYVRTP